MNHSEVLSRMADYLEGDLALGKRALFDAHIDRCASCRQEFVDLSATISLLRSLPDPEPPPFLVQHVMRRIREGEGRASFLDRCRDAVATLATPRVAIPATALIVGLMLATGNLDPSRVTLPGIAGLGERTTVPLGVSEPVRVVQRPPMNRGSQDPSFGNLPAGVQSESELDPALLAGAFNPPPAVGRAPHITIKIPVLRAIEGGPPRIATRWSGSLPQSAGVPFNFANGFTAPTTRVGSGVMQAGVHEATSSLSGNSSLNDNSLLNDNPLLNDNSLLNDNPRLGGATARDHRRRAELEARLDQLIRRPGAYAHEFASLTVAEQELWLGVLAEYAQEVGRGEEALMGLRASDDQRTLEFATAFASELRRVEADARRDVAAFAE